MRNFYIDDYAAINAYAQSPPPDGEPTYLILGKQYIDFYFAKTGIGLTPGHTLPTLHAMQGDPHAGPSWENTIAPALSDIFLKPNKIFPCLYRSTDYQGDDVIICRQVDNFKVSAKDKATVKKVMADIKNRVDFESNPKALTRFNGVDYEQICD